MSLGRRIKTAREAMSPRLTQEQLGAKFGLTAQAVSGWERNADRPDIDKLAKLARILNTTTDWLLDGHGPPERPGTRDPLYVRLSELSEQERQMLSGMVEGLIRQRTGT